MRTRIISLSDGGILIDAGSDRYMIILPSTMRHFVYFDTAGNPIHVLHQEFQCGGFEKFTSKKGRKAIRVLPGNFHVFRFGGSGGDRSWNGWYNRYPVGEGVFAQAWAASNGGGVWNELTIVPVDGGWVRADQARANEDLGL